MKTLKEDVAEDEEEEADTKITELMLKIILLVKFELMFIFKEERKKRFLKTWNNTYAFFPQMAPWYQLRQVLKYFFLVPMTCWSAQTLGLIRIEGETGIISSIHW